MPERVDATLLARYLSGECSPAEVMVVERWIAESPENRATVEQMRAVWESKFVRETPDFDPDDRVWDRLTRGMTRPTKPRLVSERTAPAPARRWPMRTAAITGMAGRVWLGAVAAGLVVTAAGLTISSRRAGQAARDAAARSATTMRRVSTKPGERANVYLSDGTHVLLDVASQLRFPTAFASARDVELEGEAYFEVALDSARVFTVHTPYGSARDLGTKFGVRAYQGAPNVTVTVVEGAVALRARAGSAEAPKATADTVILTKTDVGTIATDGRLTVARGGSTGANLAWMSGRLVFDTASVREAVAQINRWYDADVRLGDSTLARQKLTASLTNEPFAQAMQLIAGILDARIERRGHTYMLFTNRQER